MGRSPLDHPLTAYLAGSPGASTTDSGETRSAVSREQGPSDDKGINTIFERWKSRVPRKGLVEFTRSFAVLIQARMPLVQALESLAAQTEHPGLARALNHVLEHLRQGHTLSASLAQQPHVFDRTFVNLTRVGEMAGILDKVLLRLATHLEKSAALRRKVKVAMRYPAVVLGVAVAATAFLLTSIVPTFAEMFEDFGAELPGPTKAVLQVSQLATEHIGTVLLVVCLLAGGIAWHRRTASGRRFYDTMLLKIPYVKGLVRKGLMARFCRTLGTLLQSGVPLLSSLDILADAGENTVLRDAIEHMGTELRKGKSLHEPVKRFGVFPPMVVQMMAVGEETAELDTVMLHAAAYYEDEVDALVEGMTSIIEPVLIVVIGVVLGGILTALYLPMFELITVVR